jgi:bacterioferritin
MSNVEFTDIATLRQRARQHVEEGAVTEGYSADREEIRNYSMKHSQLN